MNPVEEVIVKQRIKNIADNLGVYYLVKNMSIKEVYHFLSDYFFQTEQLDITKYSFEEMRARDHYKNHEKLLKCQSEFNKQLEELKNK